MRETPSLLAKGKAFAGDKGSDDLVSPPLDTVSGEPHIPGSQKVRETRSSVGKRKADAGDEGTAGLVSRPPLDRKKKSKEKTTTGDDTTLGVTTGYRRIDVEQVIADLKRKFGGEGLRELDDSPLVPPILRPAFDSKAIPEGLEGKEGWPFPIQDFRSDDELHTKLKEFANLAMEDYNKTENTSYEVSDIMMANKVAVNGIKYYLTFQAWCPNDHDAETFEAIVVEKGNEESLSNSSE